MRQTLAIGCSLILTACGGTATMPPTIDMTGVDPGQRSRDLAWCQQNPPAVAAGNFVTNCMERKGYKILVRN